MRQEGFQPAAVARTSPGNYQAWVKHSERFDKELGTAVARELAARFGGDVKAADWRHFGRLSGFRNTKARHREVVPVPEYDQWLGQNFHRNLDGEWVDRDGAVCTEGGLREIHARLVPRSRYPFVRLVEASGAVARESERFVASAREKLEREREERARLHAQLQESAPARSAGPIKSIDQFRANAKYGGDGTRVDLAYAVYAVAHGVDPATVEAELRSRDLTHKGNEKRQRDYVERTVRKALANFERGRER